MDRNEDFMFDLETLENEAILKKRTTLTLIYMKNVKEWLSSKTTHPFRRNMEIIEKTLNGLTKNISLKMLKDLRTLLQKIFDEPQLAPIEISSDEDEEMSFEQASLAECHMNAQRDLQLDTQNHSTSKDNFKTLTESITTTSRVNLSKSSSSLLKDSADLRSSILQDLEFETRNSSPLDGVMLPAATPKQRRKSVCSKPASHADLPSIGIYAIKKTKMVPPSLYAKPKNIVENNLRQTITVPYKSASIRYQNQHDPQKDAIKLDGIKERIYAKNYLQLDADKKEEMQEAFIKNLQKVESQSSNRDNVIDGENGEKLDPQANQQQPKKQTQTLSTTQECGAKSKMSKSDMLKGTGNKPTHSLKIDHSSEKQSITGKTNVRPRKQFEDASKKAHKNSEGKRSRGRPRKTSTVSPKMNLSLPTPNNDEIEMLDVQIPSSSLKISASESSTPVPKKLGVAKSSKTESDTKNKLEPLQQHMNDDSNRTSSFLGENINEEEEDLLIEVPGKNLRKFIRKVHIPRRAKKDRKVKNSAQLALKQEKE